MKKKTIALALVLVMVFGATLGGTFAYLTSQKTITNTFTVGNVQIKLDEADMSTDDPNDRTEQGNQYHLLPGQTYAKDPTVTVLEGSEEAYVRVLVTITDCKDVDAAIAKVNAARANADPAKTPIGLMDLFAGYDGETWIYHSMTKNESATTDDYSRTYEFWYKEPVTAPEDDKDGVVEGEKLKPLFTSVNVPDEIDNTSLKSISDMQIIVNAHAIQAAGFDNADAAWAAWN